MKTILYNQRGDRDFKQLGDGCTVLHRRGVSPSRCGTSSSSGCPSEICDAEGRVLALKRRPSFNPRSWCESPKHSFATQRPNISSVTMTEHFLKRQGIKLSFHLHRAPDKNRVKVREIRFESFPRGHCTSDNSVEGVKVSIRGHWHPRAVTNFRA
jgi:hypothetical protein